LQSIPHFDEHRSFIQIDQFPDLGTLNISQIFESIGGVKKINEIGLSSTMFDYLASAQSTLSSSLSSQVDHGTFHSFESARSVVEQLRMDCASKDKQLLQTTTELEDLQKEHQVKDQRIQELEKEIERTRREHNLLDEQVGKLQQLNDDYCATVEYVGKEKETLERILQNLEKDYHQQTNQIIQSEQTINNLSRENTYLREQNGQLIAAEAQHRHNILTLTHQIQNEQQQSEISLSNQKSEIVRLTQQLHGANSHIHELSNQLNIQAQNFQSRERELIQMLNRGGDVEKQHITNLSNKVLFLENELNSLQSQFQSQEQILQEKERQIALLEHMNKDLQSNQQALQEYTELTNVLCLDLMGRSDRTNHVEAVSHFFFADTQSRLALIPALREILSQRS